MKSLQPLKVLLIEDNPSDVLLLRTALDTDLLSSFSLTHVERLADGLKQVQENTFDVVLTDLGLPDSSGLDTFERLHKRQPDVPILVFSGNEDQEQAVEAMRDGAQDYLVKSLSGFDMAARSIRHAIERNKLQSTLRESEERYRLLFNSIPTAIIHTDLEYQILNWNAAAQKMYGWTDPQAIIGKPMQDVVHPKYIHQPREEVVKTLLAQDHWQDEVIHHRQDGTPFPVLASGTLVKDRLKNGIGYVAINVDITDRHKAEEALKESETRFSTAFFTSPVSQSIIKLGTNEILEVNEACCRLFEYSREELIGASTAKLNLWENPVERLAALEELQKRGRLLPREVATRMKSGRMRTVIAAIEPISWKGAPSLISFVFDITDRKQAEETLRRSEERLRQILQTTSDGFWLVDSNRRFLDVNEAYCTMSGYTREEFLQLGISDVEATELVRETNERIGKIIRQGSDKFEARHRRKDGTVFDVDISVNVLSQEAGLMICFIRDITARKATEEALRESRKLYQQFISQSFEAIYRTEFDQPVDTSLPIEEQIDQIYATAYMAECNQAMADMYHIPREEIVGMRLIDAHGGKDSQINRDAFRRLIQNEYRSIDDETVEYDSQGDKIWFLSNTIGTVEDGKLVRLWGTSIEITDRKRAEAALRESNERFQQIAETMQEVFWIFDNLQKRLLYVSPGYEVIWGRSIKDLYENPRQSLESVLPEDRHLAVEALASRDQGQPAEVEFRIWHTSGEQRWVHYRSFPVLDANGMLIRTTGIATDITTRKQAEQEALYRQELLEKVIQLGKDIAILTDLDRCLLEIYKSARFGLGFDRVGLFLYDANLRHVLGAYGTTRTGEIEEPGFFDGPLQEFGSAERALNSPSGVSWLEDFQKHFNLPEGHTMYGVGQHIVVAAWAGEKPVALITVDNLLSGRKIKPAQVEALQLFAGYAGLAIENASLHAELELKVEERTAEVQDLYDNAPTGYHSLDINGCFIQINQTELRWLGYTKEEVLGHPLKEFITEQSRAIFQENFPRFKQIGVLRDLELEMVRKDGSTFPVLINATAIRDGRGNYIMSRSTIFDNTEHKRAEDALRQNEETYRALFENANDGIFIFGLDNRLLRANPHGADLLGYSVDELVGKIGNNFIDSENVEDAEQKWQRIIAGERLPAHERKLLRRDGSWIETEINLSLIRDASGRPQFIQSVVRDVSTRKHAEETLRLANVELERALRLKDEFLASMSHELRTPLTGILGLSEALQYDTYGEMNPKQMKVIANIESNGHHLLDLINDILDISKMEAGKLELDMVPCSLDDICQSSLQLVTGMAHKKGQHMAFSMNPAGITVKGDSRRLKQIIVNLLSNAVKYTPEGRAVGLDIAADASTQTVRIDVWDQGMGITPNDLKRLFQPFVQLDSSLSRQQGGTGLGLALVQRLVDLHGGSIQVESGPGQGSRFTVRLPYLQGTSEAKEKPQDQELSQIQQSLIVEDNAIDANRLRRFLKMLGIQAMVETRGDGVVEKALASRPGVILLDINLPDMTGWDVLDRLKKNETTRSIPVVITSVVEERERANKLGAAGYLLKLFTLDELRHILSRIPKQAGAHNDRALVISPNMHPGVVMIVDDNETNVLMLEDFLQSRSYKVFSSHSGFDFLAQVTDIRPDMVLMDIQMPDMDGLETIRRLRDLPDPELASTPVIAITALAMPGDRERCLDAGANEYVSKPIRLKELATMIQKMLLDQQDLGS